MASGSDDIMFAVDSAFSGTVTISATTFNSGCQGNTEMVMITVNPLPMFASSFSDTVCSDEGANIDLSALNMNGMAGVTFTYDAPTLSAGLSGAASTQTLAFESFEGTAAEHGYDNSDEVYISTSDYFTRTNDGTVNPISSSVYSGIDGDFFWAAEDIDGFPDNSSLLPRSLTLDPISIAGQSNLRFDGLFAGRNSSPRIDDTDAFFVEYRIDGGTWIKGLQFSSSAAGSNNTIALDADMNGLGEGAVLTPAFTSFGFDIAGTGNTLDVRVVVSVNSGNE
jgi:hypothetical protein